MGIAMLPLSLLFTCTEKELQALWASLDLASLGLTFGDGTTSTRANGILIYCGASFDFTVSGAAPSDAEYHIFCSVDISGLHASISLGLGGAIASGQQVPAIVKALLSLGRVLGSAMGAKAIYWHPARIMTGFSYYAEAIGQYEGNAAFPSLVTVGFDSTSGDIIQTSGLAWLCGQELLFERGGMPVNEAMRYMVRLVHDLVTNGAIERQMEVPGMDDGEQLMLRPDDDNRLLIVARKYSANDVNSAD